MQPSARRDAEEIVNRRSSIERASGRISPYHLSLIAYLFVVDLPDRPCYDSCHKYGRPGCCESVRQMVRAEPLRPRRLMYREPEPLHLEADRKCRTGCPTH